MANTEGNRNHCRKEAHHPEKDSGRRSEILGLGFQVGGKSSRRLIQNEDQVGGSGGNRRRQQERMARADGRWSNLEVEKDASINVERRTADDDGRPPSQRRTTESPPPPEQQKHGSKSLIREVFS